jgi:hypothetical protein
LKLNVIAVLISYDFPLVHAYLTPPKFGGVFLLKEQKMAIDSNNKQEVDSALSEVLSALASVSTVDDRIVAFCRGKRSKLRFFYKAGRTTTILLAVIPFLVGGLLGFLIGSV